MKFRYYLTRLFFWCLGIRVAKWSKRIDAFWKLGAQERRQARERILQSSAPLNANGETVTSIESLERSPVLTKQRYRESIKPSGAAVFKRKTSGTTGDPTQVVLSREELSRMLGVREYCFRHYGLRVGEREARFWGRAEEGWKSNLKNFVLNRKVCFPSGEGASESVVKVLSWKPVYFYGYASLLLEAARFVEQGNMDFTPPKCVICTAEMILPAQKEYLAKVFRAPVAEEYGASEFDIVAFECKSGHRHLVNPWLVLQERDESLLISDISRKSTSLINYDIGDSGSIANVRCSQLGDADCLTVLAGRSINRFVYVDHHTKFHVIEVAYAINEYQGNFRTVFGFRIVQENYGTLDLYVSEAPQLGLESLASSVKNYIRKKTGHDVEIHVLSGRKPLDPAEKTYFIQRISTLGQRVTVT